LDRVLTVASLVVYSLPVFWLGFVFVFLFVEQFRLFPIGWGSSIRYLVLPSLTLGLIGAAGTARFHRDAMLNVRRMAFVRTARSKGLSQAAVTVHHIVRNALAPTITLLGLSLPVLLSGSVFVERVFQWHGIGSLTVDAVTNREYHLATSATLLVAVMVVLSNFLADLLHRALDPRVRSLP
jgi:peptide/nickel transport system permease protein